MSEWRDFLEGLDDEERIIIELTIALDAAWLKFGTTLDAKRLDTQRIEQALEAGRDFTRKYVRDLV